MGQGKYGFVEPCQQFDAAFIVSVVSGSRLNRSRLKIVDGVRGEPVPRRFGRPRKQIGRFDEAIVSLTVSGAATPEAVARLRDSVAASGSWPDRSPKTVRTLVCKSSENRSALISRQGCVNASANSFWWRARRSANAVRS